MELDCEFNRPTDIILSFGCAELTVRGDFVA